MSLLQGVAVPTNRFIFTRSVEMCWGGEFDLAPTTPEPGTLIMLGSGIVGLAGVLRRKINL